MTAYTLSANATLRDIGNASIWGVATARSGGDTVNTNGFKLTIDQDSRYGFSGTTSTTWGSLTINASKGGEIHIDGTKVWLIPFTGGSGTLTLGTQITIGGVTCNTIGIYTSLTSAPTTTGESGWLKVTNASGTPGTISSGTYAGFTLTANGSAVRGWIEINGDDAGTINANRLGVFRVTGSWYELGTTSGVSNQTLQIPNHGLSQYYAGVFIEKTAGQEDYEFWPNAGTVTSMGTDEIRGKVVWIDATGLVRIGNSGAATNGHTPTAGRKVVVPNVNFQCNTAAARTANVIPNTTIATRYDFTTTGAGVLEIDKGNFAWYLSVSQAYSVNISNSGFVDAISLDEVASPMTFVKVGVGNRPTTALSINPLTLTECFAGGTFTDCVWTRVAQAASGAHINTLTDCSGFSFIRDTMRANTVRGNSTTYSLNATRILNCTFDSPTIIQGAMAFSSCSNISITNTSYIESCSSTTVTTYTGHVWYISSFSSNISISGLSFPVTNTHPYTALLGVYNGSYNIKLRSIASRTNPLSMGTVNACAHVIVANTSSTDIKVQRVYASLTRTGFYSVDNSVYRVTLENCSGDYADADAAVANNMKIKACGFTNSETAASAVYGTHWLDVFTSTTAGRLYIRLNEPNTSTSSYFLLENGAAFTGAGGLYMPTIGMSCTFELDYFAIGHSGFQNTALVMGGGTATNYTYEYAIDKNDGNGWSTMTSSNYTATTLGTALSGIVGIDASKGFKLKLKITTSSNNTTAITAIRILTNSTAELQDTLYPLDVSLLTLTGIQPNSEVRCYLGTDPLTAVEIAGTESSSNSFSFLHSSGGMAGYIVVFNNNYQAWRYELTYPSSDYSIPVQQIIDRSFTNP